MTENFISILLDATAKSLIAFFPIALIAIFFGHNAVMRHRIWAAAILTLAAMPILSLALPSWTVNVPAEWVLFANASTSAPEAIPNQPSPSSSLEANRRGANTDIGHTPKGGGAQNMRQPRVQADSPSSDTVSSAPNSVDDALAESGASEIANDVAPATSSIEPMESTSARLPLPTGNPNQFAVSPIAAIVGAWSVIAAVLLLRLVVSLFVIKSKIRNAKHVGFVETNAQGECQFVSLESKNKIHSPANAIKVVESTSVSGPAACGLWAKTILFPTAWRDWSSEKLNAVLAHERSHIERRDSWVHLVAELVCAMHWFNPLSWFYKSRLAATAELACDQMAALATGDRIAYAQHLLEIAASTTLPQPRHRTGFQIAMARTTDLESRIEHMIDLKRPIDTKSSLSVQLAIGASIVLLATAIAAFRPEAAKATSSPSLASKTESTPTETTPVANPLTPAIESSTPLTADDGLFRTIDGVTYMVVKGEVVLPDGTAPTKIEAITQGFTHESIVSSIQGNKIEVLVPNEMAYVIVQTPDNRFRIRLWMDNEFLDSYVKTKKATWKLEPAFPLYVRVIDENEKPVAAARVSCNSDPSFTNDKGETVVFHRNPTSGIMASKLDGTVSMDSSPSFDKSALENPLVLKLQKRKSSVRLLCVTKENAPAQGVILFDKGYGIDESNAEGVVFAPRDRAANSNNFNAFCHDDPNWKLVESVQQGDDIKIVVEPRPKRQKIKGRVEPKELVPIGTLVSVSENKRVRTGANGEFVFEPSIDKSCVIKLDSPDVICMPVVVDAEQNGAEAILKVSKGNRVTVHFSEGAQVKPIANQQVSIYYLIDEHQYLDRSFGMTTDEKGMVVFAMHPTVKKIKVFYNMKQEEIELSFDKAGNAQAMVNYTVPKTKSYSIVALYNENDSKMAELKAFSYDQNKEIEVKKTADHYYQVDSSDSLVVVSAKAENGFMWNGRLKPENTRRNLVIPRAIPLKYRAKVIDQNDRPVVGKEFFVSGLIRFTESDLATRDDFSRPYPFRWHFFPQPAKTDANGFISLDSVPGGGELAVSVVKSKELLAHNYDVPQLLIRTMTPKAGEKEVTDVFRIWNEDDKIKSLSYKEFANELDKAFKAAESKNMKVLVVGHAGLANQPGFLPCCLFNPDRVPETKAFVPFEVNSTYVSQTMPSDSPAYSIAPRVVVTNDERQLNGVTLAIFKNKHEILAKETFDPSDENVTAKISEFLKANH
ncbi:MAG: M56 family metallopeptidase [Pirellulaceae bacterium]